MQQLKLENGDPTFRQLAEAIGYLRGNTLSRAVSVPNAEDGETLRPGKWEFIRPYVEALGGDVSYFRDRYLQACQEMGLSSTIDPPMVESERSALAPPRLRVRLLEIIAKNVAQKSRIAHNALTTLMVAILILMSVVAAAAAPGIAENDREPATSPCHSVGQGCVAMDASSGRVLWSTDLYAQPSRASRRTAALTEGDFVRVSCFTRDADLEAAKQQSLDALDRARRELLWEGDGVGLSGLAGRGPVYLEKRQSYERLLEQTQALVGKVNGATWLYVDAVYGWSASDAAGWIPAEFVGVTPGNSATTCQR